jgi:ankyrin repeat protein
MGFAGNSHHVAPSGMLPAVKYLVEELGADVNAVDADGNSVVHNAASRGDTEMIRYLVSKGADVKKINRSGQTTIDVAKWAGAAHAAVSRRRSRYSRASER